MFQLPVELNEGAANPKQELLAENKDSGGQNPQIQQAEQPDLPRKPDVRQEPPVPVEPAAVPSASVPEKKESKDIIQQVRVNKLHYDCITGHAVA
jgi:hypothetical protein